MSAMSDLDLRFSELCRKCRNLRMATRLWNWIDNQAEPEGYWSVMAREIPWAFRNPANVNTMRFVYRRRKFDGDFSGYEKTRKKVARKLAEIRAYIGQLAELVRAMPATNEEAGYLDLDNIQQIDSDLDGTAEILLTENAWDDLGAELARHSK